MDLIIREKLNIKCEAQSVPAIMREVPISASRAIHSLESGTRTSGIRDQNRGYSSVRFDSGSNHQPAESVRNTHIQSSSKDLPTDPEWITRTSELQRLLGQAKSFAATDVSILLTGESGTGKDVLARIIHNHSGRTQKPFVAMNCGALPFDLVESELFGFEKGAFSGAVQAKSGSFEQADGGTLFLDEIGELPLPMQVKLLRAVESGTFRRLGAQKEMSVDIRILAATNRSLQTEILQNRFRKDLFYRLSVVQLHIPSLRERRGDIALLSGHFLKQFSKKYARHVGGFTDGAMNLLSGYDWPGNVRELRNIVERAFVLCSGTLIDTHHLPFRVSGSNHILNTQWMDALGYSYSDGSEADGAARIAQTDQRHAMVDHFVTHHADNGFRPVRAFESSYVAEPRSTKQADYFPDEIEPSQWSRTNRKTEEHPSRLDSIHSKHSNDLPRKTRQRERQHEGFTFQGDESSIPFRSEANGSHAYQMNDRNSSGATEYFPVRSSDYRTRSLNGDTDLPGLAGFDGLERSAGFPGFDGDAGSAGFDGKGGFAGHTGLENGSASKASMERLPSISTGGNQREKHVLGYAPSKGTFRPINNGMGGIQHHSSSCLKQTNHTTETLDGIRRLQDRNGILISVGMTLEEAESELILMTLASVMNNKSEAARILGCSRKTLHNKFNRIRRERFREK